MGEDRDGRVLVVRARLAVRGMWRIVRRIIMMDSLTALLRLW